MQVVVSIGGSMPMSIATPTHEIVPAFLRLCVTVTAALTSILLPTAHVSSSPLTNFHSVERSCPDSEFVSVLKKWVAFNGEYLMGVTWLARCSRNPESNRSLLRRLKEEVFKFEKPPDIPGYVAAMSESPTRKRIARAWRVFTYLVDDDKRAYSPNERNHLMTIPDLLEQLALRKIEDSHEEMCKAELHAAALLRFSKRETEFWGAVEQIKARRDLSSEDRLMLKRAYACLMRQYEDPSIGREAIINHDRFPPAVFEKGLVTDSLRRFVTTCERWAATAASTPEAPFRMPQTQVDASLLVMAEQMRKDCGDLTPIIEAMNDPYFREPPPASAR